MSRQYSFIYNPALDYKKDDIFDTENPVYKAVEKLFLNLGLDKNNYNKPSWNPLGEFIKPGNKVVIKPNLVASQDKEKRLKGEILLASCTNPAVLYPLINYTWRALKGRGRISIVDSPIEGSDFRQTVKDLGFDKMINFLKKQKKINLKLLDLRDFKMIPYMLLDNFVLGNYSFNLGFLRRKKLPGDPHGYLVVDLKENSFLGQKDWEYSRLRFHRANPCVPIQHHDLKKNEYSIAKTVLEADVFINVPKLKTHKKAGVTLSLKNLVGIVNEKYWLPHYRAGAPPLGDEYPYKFSFREVIHERLSRFPLPFGHSFILNIVNQKKHKKIITEGNWEGNDTLWRVVLDLNKILFFADRKGKLRKKAQRKYFTLVDGIIAGEGDGPLNPVPKKCGLLIGGFNPALVDLVTIKAMGFNFRRLKQITQALELFEVDQGQIEKVLSLSRLNLDFVPPFGWGSLRS